MVIDGLEVILLLLSGDLVCFYGNEWWIYYLIFDSMVVDVDIDLLVVFDVGIIVD